MKKFGLLMTFLGLFGFASAHAAGSNTASVTIQITAAIQKTASVTNNGVSTTTYTTASGEPLRFEPGQVWIVLTSQ